MALDLEHINRELKNLSPQEIVDWALTVAKTPIVTTNFRPLEAAILHATTCCSQDIPVVWCDTGYNTPATYRHAKRTIDQLSLNIDVYVPKQSVGYRNATLGIPEIDTPEHAEFTEQVKLEPFKRAMNIYKPDVWFTNLRKGQTALRSELDIVTQTKDGMLKVCPFYYWTDPQIEAYIKHHDLETESNYYDPTKALENRECGLHT